MQMPAPDFLDALYDTSDDSAEDPSTFMSKMASQRPRTGCFRPVSLFEEEYPKEESTDSDCSLELSLENKEKKKITSQNSCKSSHQNSFKSSSQSQFESSQSRSFETSHDSTQRFPDSRADVNEEVAQTCTNKKRSGSMPLEKEANVYVDSVLKKKDGARRYNKKHHCLYCRHVVQKMSRHLLRKHSDKVDVAKAFSLPKNSKERRRLSKNS